MTYPDVCNGCYELGGEFLFYPKEPLLFLNTFLQFLEQKRNIYYIKIKLKIHEKKQKQKNVTFCVASLKNVYATYKYESVTK